MESRGGGEIWEWARGQALLCVGALAAASCAMTPSVDEVLDGSAAPPAVTVGAERAPSPTADPERTAPSPESSDGSSAGPPTEASRPADEASTVAERPGASAGDAPPRPTGRAELAALAEQRLQQSAVESSALLATAREEDASYGDLMAAARALILNADLRLQSTLALAPGGEPLPGPEGLIDLEDDVSEELKAEIRSLATSSADLSDRALQLRPGDAAAELFSTLGTGLRLWSMPTFQALASGAATTLPGKIKQLAVAAPEFEGASPLRLKGRFQSRAPWPFKDLEGGRTTLAAAVEAAPIPLNLLFLGDAHWLCGEPEAARARWREAMEAEADAETEGAAPFIREIARLRLEGSNGAAER